MLFMVGLMDRVSKLVCTQPIDGLMSSNGEGGLVWTHKDRPDPDWNDLDWMHNRSTISCINLLQKDRLFSIWCNYLTNSYICLRDIENSTTANSHCVNNITQSSLLRSHYY